MSTDLAHKLVDLCIALMGVIGIVGLFSSYLSTTTRGMLKTFMQTMFVCITLLAIAVYINTEYL